MEILLSEYKNDTGYDFDKIIQQLCELNIQGVNNFSFVDGDLLECDLSQFEFFCKELGKIKEIKFSFKTKIESIERIKGENKIFEELLFLGLDTVDIHIGALSDCLEKRSDLLKKIIPFFRDNDVNLMLDLSVFEPNLNMEKLKNELSFFDEMELWRYSPIFLDELCPDKIKMPLMIFNSESRCQNPEVELIRKNCRSWSKYVLPLYLKISSLQETTDQKNPVYTFMHELCRLNFLVLKQSVQQVEEKMKFYLSRKLFFQNQKAYV